MELKSGVGAVSIGIEEVRQTELAEADFDPALGKQGKKRESVSGWASIGGTTSASAVSWGAAIGIGGPGTDASCACTAGETDRIDS